MIQKHKRLLKILVLSMGIILLLFFMLGHVVRQETAKTCPGGRVDLKGRGEILGYTEENGVLRVRLQKPGGDTEIVLVDVCTGEIKSSLTIDADALKLPE